MKDLTNQKLSSSEKQLTIGLAQLNPIACNIEYNTRKVEDIINENRTTDIIVFPEMILTGYPIMDHIYDTNIQYQNQIAINRITKIKTSSTIILGTFTIDRDKMYNSALVIENNRIVKIVNKRKLPNYDIFDEKRHFDFDNNCMPIEIKGYKIGILICEDIWNNEPSLNVSKELVNNGAEILISINASPYYIKKPQERNDLIINTAREFSVPIIYVNMVGGTDEIVYDGRSTVVDKNGNIIYTLDAFRETFYNTVIPTKTDNNTKIIESNWCDETIEALKLNLKDYITKLNIFNGIVLGISGGIDSAFSAYIACETVGSDKVTGILLPTSFTSKTSITDAKQLCQNLNMKYIVFPIKEIYDMYQKYVIDILKIDEFDIADENLQARIRANILMYYSNKYNSLLISTGNKSEISVGYCTLYGDTAGGKNIPGDLFKTEIYKLCDWINRDREIIPKNILDKPPTAELRDNQKDSDSLPEYPVLDTILKEIINNGLGAEQIYYNDQLIDNDIIQKVKQLYINSEFKRRQLVQTIKVTKSTFGIGRRYPVTKKIKI